MEKASGKDCEVGAFKTIPKSGCSARRWTHCVEDGEKPDGV
jgi:hypothetical protein